MSNINDLGFPFTSIAGDRQYSASEWRRYFETLVENGVIGDIANELQVKPQVSPNKTIFVDTGAIMINGAVRDLISVVNLTIADNTSGNPRIDRIVARLNYTDRKIEFAVKQGTPAGSPTAPSLTQHTTSWELALADILLANGYSTIVEVDITDQRLNESVCGYFKYRAKPAWYPSVGTPAMETWMYIMFRNQLTSQEKVDIEENPTLMAVINNNTLPATDSYSIFCTNANATSLDAAFGKNNTSWMRGIGHQLAMYAWFKGASTSTYLFTVLRTKQTLVDCLADPYSIAEIMDDTNIKALIQASTGYAKALYDAIPPSDALFAKTIIAAAGLDPDSYADMTAIAASSTAISAITASARAMAMVAQSGILLNKFIKSSTAKTALIANATIFNTVKTVMLATLNAATTLFTKTACNQAFVTNTLTIGTANSIVFIDSCVDNGGGDDRHWLTAKHNHNQVELLHAAFPTLGTHTSVSPVPLAVGGFIGTIGGSFQSQLLVSSGSYKYEAV